eukprot:TRINITY_DN5043_c0_g1_i4.p1 TRINITY_DN5043_c0_g1~~TRINITY_DN5043_c0_g1_i4.p1  ORF type:complete len:198 (+),score=-22.40 TRINITY_DN5043_c0_g1_i4:491-1084(+)
MSNSKSFVSRKLLLNQRINTLNQIIKCLGVIIVSQVQNWKFLLSNQSLLFPCFMEKKRVLKFVNMLKCIICQNLNIVITHESLQQKIQFRDTHSIEYTVCQQTLQKQMNQNIFISFSEVHHILEIRISNSNPEFQISHFAFCILHLKTQVPPLFIHMTVFMNRSIQDHLETKSYKNKIFASVSMIQPKLYHIGQITT